MQCGTSSMRKTIIHCAYFVNFSTNVYLVKLPLRYFWLLYDFTLACMHCAGGK